QQARDVFASAFGRSWEDLGMEQLYDVAHNIAKLEEHTVEGKKKKVWVHRKGATRAFPAGHPEVPEAFRAVGQPVIIPGDMGRASWILVGSQGAMEKTFGTTCHGAGRAMSRTAAKLDGAGRKIDKELENRGGRGRVVRNGLATRLRPLRRHLRPEPRATRLRELRSHRHSLGRERRRIRRQQAVRGGSRRPRGQPGSGTPSTVLPEPRARS